MTNPASDAGDTLIEVIVSALLVALIVVGTFSGLDSTNKATALQRSRSQADALAQQNEEQLRSESIKKLDELESHPETKTVTEGKTVYTVETSATYYPDASATSSCTSSSAEAGYLRTTSKVTWNALLNAKGELVGKPVEESSAISPPAGSALIVQVQESGTALPGALVAAQGPSPATTSYELETSSKGCAILALPRGGEYNIYVSKSGYVDPNGYPNTHEDLSTTRSVYLPAETTAKEGYNIGKAGKLAVSFHTGATTSEGDSFVAFNTLMTSYRKFTTEPVGTYQSPVESPTPNSIFPFTNNYTVYAGTCEADLPPSSVITENESHFLTTVPRGETRSIETIQPPVNIIVKSGKSASEPGAVVTTATGSTTDGCSTMRSFTSTPGGALPHPGLPFGKYSMCVGNGGRKWEGAFENNTINGPTEASIVTPPNNGGIKTVGSTNYGIIYLGTSPSGAPAGTTLGSCP